MTSGSGPGSTAQASLGPELLGPELLGPELLGPELLGPEPLGPESLGAEQLGSEALGLETLGSEALGLEALAPELLELRPLAETVESVVIPGTIYSAVAVKPILRNTLRRSMDFLGGVELSIIMNPHLHLQILRCPDWATPCLLVFPLLINTIEQL